MNTSRARKHKGFTLTELIVVLAIGTVIMALAVPGVARLGIFARDEMHTSAREIFSLLQAARVYASAHNVNTAVVYAMDNYVPRDVDAANTPGLREPLVDSFTQGNIRVLVAAAVMYELPSKSGVFKGNYVPVAGDQGNFQPLQGEMVIPLELSKRFGDNVREVSTPTGVLLSSDRPRLEPGDDMAPLNEIGLSRINVYPEGHGPLALSGPDTTEKAFTEPFLAHVFGKDGSLLLVDGGASKSSGRERFTFYVAPAPNVPIANRYDDDFATGHLLGIPLEIFKSSGRVRIATEEE